MKQAHVAELASVCQTTVSRWESGEITPAPDIVDTLLEAMSSSSADDPALRRLVENSGIAVHLIADTDHRLLAASPARELEWGRSASELIGSSLWRFATEEIVAAEHRLVDDGWWEAQAPGVVEVHTGGRVAGDLTILAGAMIWERAYLADGTPARICSSPAAKHA